ncbi:cytochrome C554 [candidate division KSB1 bacterium]|nr:cytochrome C554 [candidate division KSB1 bacterium]
MKRVLALVLIVAFICILGTIYAGEKNFQYVGASKCKMCHKSEKSGNQYGLWMERKHSKAYATLATAESKEVAQKAGVTGDPQKAKECLVCHVTAFEASDAQKAETLTLEEGVSCEACHGPGSEYKGMKVMKGIYAKTMKGADYGLIAPSEEVCVKCHNTKSPTYQKFEYAKAVKIVSHPVPKK